MKIIASVSIEIKLDDTELLDDAKDRAVETLIDNLDDWLNNNGIPPIISIEYKLPEYDDNDLEFLN
tara:strand:+ start:118 stop:315 length:198 start_codon:yes stop_codon:yes gene_type:complete